MSNKINASPGQKSDAIGSLGNNNFWVHWIASLEENIQNEAEATKPLSGATCFVCWLLLSSEYIAYRLRQLLYFHRDFKDQEVFDYSYGKLQDAVAKEMPEKISKDLDFVIKVRHIFVHKGFPNPQEVPTKRGGKKVKSPKEEIVKIRDLIRKPANYEKIKARFNSVNSWIGKNTRAVTFGF